jgi:hypothetical protein
MKRVEEMVESGRNLTFQSTIITDNTPGTWVNQSITVQCGK